MYSHLETVILVHKLGGKPDHTAIHIHPLPEKLFDKLKKMMPYAEWKKPPVLLLRYYPVDWLLESGNTQGVAICMTVQATAHCDPIILDDKVYELGFASYIHQDWSSQSLRLSFRFTGSGANRIRKKIKQEYKELAQKATVVTKGNEVCEEDQENNHSINNGTTLSQWDKMTREHSIELSYAQLESIISEEERQLFSYVVDRQQSQNKLSNEHHDSFTVIAYNGVLIDSKNILGTGDSYINITLLLSDKDSPDVTLARDGIISFPLELACDLNIRRSRLAKLTYSHEGVPDSMSFERYAFHTNKEYWDLLDLNPNWEKKLQAMKWSLKPLSELDKIVKTNGQVHTQNFYRKLSGLFVLAILQKHFSLKIETADYSAPILIEKRDEPDLSPFPPCLFFHPQRDGAPFGKISPYSTHMNYYNLRHPFSKWLIEQRESLQDKVLGQYQQILEIMILGEKADEIRERLNNILRNLRSFQDNLFEITDELLLTEKDFTRNVDKKKVSP